MCAVDFTGIRICGLADSQPEALRDDSGIWMMNFELSDEPPDEWRLIFLERWRIGGPLTRRKPEFTTAGGVPCLKVRCHANETSVVQAQLDHAKRKTDEANQVYHELLAEKESEQQAREAANTRAEAEAASTINRLKKDLDFE